MIKRKDACRHEVRAGMRGGDGQVKIEHIWEAGSELQSPSRLFARLILAPGDSIGSHCHDREEEVFLVLRGRAEVDDNGVREVLEAGDSLLTGNGRSHAVRNIGSDTLEILAVIMPFADGCGK